MPKKEYIRKHIDKFIHQPIIQYSVKKIKTEYQNASGKTIHRTKCVKGDKIKEWKGSGEIKRVLGFDKSAVLRCCKGMQIQAYWYIWRFKKDVKGDF